MGKNTKKLNRKSGNSRNNKRIRGVLIGFLIIACIVLAGHGEMVMMEEDERQRVKNIV